MRSVKLLPGQVQADFQGIIRPVLKSMGRVQLAQGAARGLHHLQGPEYPVGVPRGQAPGRGRVQGLQAGVQGREALVGQFPGQLRPDLVDRVFLGEETGQQGLDVQAGAPRHQRGHPALAQTGDDRAALPGITRRVVGFVGVGHIH